MRIIGGEQKGRRLLAPEGLHTRPTADRVREAMFSVLLPRLAEARVLDAFAGSGALGLEALSRGAASVLFVEKDYRALKALRRNVEHCAVEGAKIFKGDSLSKMASLKEEFDIIFLDPPYNQGLLPKALELVASHNLLRDEGLVVGETTTKNSEFLLPAGLCLLKTSFYGDTALYYCAKEGTL